MDFHVTLAARRNALSDPLRAALLMIGACLCFASMLTLVRYLSADIHPIQSAFFRNLFGLLALLPWLVRDGLPGLKTRRFGAHLVRAAFGLTAMVCLFLSVSLMPLAEATALTFTAPLFATAGAALFLGETVRIRRWAATVIGFCGTLIILRPGAETLSGGAPVALAAAAFMAAAMLMIKLLSRTESPNAIVFYFGALATPASFVIALFFWTTPTPVMWLWFALLGGVATLGQVLLTRAFAAADASAVIPFDFARLVFVSVFAYLLFGQIPDLWTWIGAAVIFAAVLYITHRESRLGAAKPPPTT